MRKINARVTPPPSGFLTPQKTALFVGYMRISKSDGTQTLALQRDALTEAGVDPRRLYEDQASGRRDDRPGLTACCKALQPGNTRIWGAVEQKTGLSIES